MRPRKISDKGYYSFTKVKLNGDKPHELEMEIELTDAGKIWFQEHYPQGIVWEYDVDTPSKLLSWASEFIEITYLGIPYRISSRIDGKLTIRKTDTFKHKSKGGTWA